MSLPAAQTELFGPAAPTLPPGMTYQEDFLGLEEEAALLAVLRDLPLRPAQYQGYTARREVIGYGVAIDGPGRDPAEDLPPALQALQTRVADWMGRAPAELVHILVTRYAPGTPLGWHLDAPLFEEVAGVSLGGTATLRFRRHPPLAPKAKARADILRLDAAPRSIYRLHGPARWAWQHSVAPTREERWSVTFRTAKVRAA